MTFRTLGAQCRHIIPEASAREFVQGNRFGMGKKLRVKERAPQNKSKSARLIRNHLFRHLPPLVRQVGATIYAAGRCKWRADLSPVGIRETGGRGGYIKGVALRSISLNAAENFLSYDFQLTYCGDTTLSKAAELSTRISANSASQSEVRHSKAKCLK